MSDQWTVENHPHPEWTVPTWFVCAPRKWPRAEIGARLIGRFLPDGRRVYGFPTQERAQRSADRVNNENQETPHV